MIVLLAWFSAITHLAGLTTLRSYFRFRAQQRTIRVVLMFILILLLIAALVPTGFIDWGNPSNHHDLASSPVVDYFDISASLACWNAYCRPGGSPCLSILMAKTMQAMIMSALLLVIGFVGRVIRLYPALSSAVTHYAQRPLARFSRRLLNKPIDLALFKFDDFLGRLWIDLVIVPLIGLHLCLRWTAEIYSSMLFEVSSHAYLVAPTRTQLTARPQIMWLLVVFIWGLMRLLFMRVIQDKVLQEHEGLDPNPWSFGQTIAVALLASPLFSLICKLGIRETAGTTDSCSRCDHDRHATSKITMQETSTRRRGDSVELDSLIINETGNTEDGSPSGTCLENELPKTSTPKEIDFTRTNFGRVVGKLSLGCDLQGRKLRPMRRHPSHSQFRHKLQDRGRHEGYGTVPSRQEHLRVLDHQVRNARIRAAALPMRWSHDGGDRASTGLDLPKPQRGDQDHRGLR